MVRLALVCHHETILETATETATVCVIGISRYISLACFAITRCLVFVFRSLCVSALLHIPKLPWTLSSFKWEKRVFKLCVRMASESQENASPNNKNISKIAGAKTKSVDVLNVTSFRIPNVEAPASRSKR